MTRPPAPAHLLASICLAAFLAGCTTTPTPYQAATDGYGYAEQQLEDNRYRVSFSGNAATPRQAVENYLLYRAAEITVQSGHDYFTVVDRDIETNYTGTASPRVGVGVGGGGNVGFGVGLSTLFGAGATERFTAFADILVFEGEKPASDPNSYDARDVLRRLDPGLAPPAA
jgi:hypothetical protein